MIEMKDLMETSLVAQLLEKGGRIEPLIVENSKADGLGLCNPSIWHKEGTTKYLVNVRKVSYYLHHCEGEQKYQTPWGPLNYVRPDDDPYLRTDNFICDFNLRNMKLTNPRKINTNKFTKEPEWDFVGIEIQWYELEKHFRKAGLAPGLPGTAWRTSTPLYKGSKQVGYATSGTWSPILKRYIALAHVKTAYADEGSELMFELKVEHYRKLTPAKVVKTPFFDPERKRSCPV